MALNIFPFIAAPLIKEFLNIPTSEYQNLMEERTEEVSKFIINSLKV